MLRLDPEPLPVEDSDVTLLGETLSVVLAFVLVLVAAAGAVMLARMVVGAVARLFRQDPRRCRASAASARRATNAGAQSPSPGPPAV